MSILLTANGLDSGLAITNLTGGRGFYGSNETLTLRAETAYDEDSTAALFAVAGEPKAAHVIIVYRLASPDEAVVEIVNYLTPTKQPFLSWSKIEIPINKEALLSGDISWYPEAFKDDNSIIGAEHADLARAGAGSDILLGRAGADKLYGDADDDQLSGGDDNDTLNGGSGDDLLRGGEGNDKLSGGDDKDRLLGEAGKDKINGGKGNDRLAGGEDRDTFIFKSNDGKDRIDDYEAGVDRIKISGAEDFKDLRLRERGDDLLVKFEKCKITFKDTSEDSVDTGDFLF
jgi:Ca2+-binding RTX toxin-like protein